MGPRFPFSAPRQGPQGHPLRGRDRDSGFSRSADGPRSVFNLSEMHSRSPPLMFSPVQAGMGVAALTLRPQGPQTGDCGEVSDPGLGAGVHPAPQETCVVPRRAFSGADEAATQQSHLLYSKSSDVNGSYPLNLFTYRLYRSS